MVTRQDSMTVERLSDLEELSPDGLRYMLAWLSPDVLPTVWDDAMDHARRYEVGLAALRRAREERDASL